MKLETLKSRRTKSPCHILVDKLIKRTQLKDKTKTLFLVIYLLRWSSVTCLLPAEFEAVYFRNQGWLQDLQISLRLAHTLTSLHSSRSPVWPVGFWQLNRSTKVIVSTSVIPTATATNGMPKECLPHAYLCWPAAIYNILFDLFISLLRKK